MSDLANSTSDEAEAEEKLTSIIARNQTKAGRTGPEPYNRDSSSGERLASIRLSRQAAYEDRLKLRAEMYKNSLHWLSSRHPGFFQEDFHNFGAHRELQDMVESSSGDEDEASEAYSAKILQGSLFASLAPRSFIDINILAPGHRISISPSTLHASVSLYLTSVRNMASLVNQNCSRLQRSGRAGYYINAIVLPYSTLPVVLLKPISVGAIQIIMRRLDSCMPILTKKQAQEETHELENTERLLVPIAQVFEECFGILESFHPRWMTLRREGLEDHIKTLSDLFIDQPESRSGKRLRRNYLRNLLQLRICVSILQVVDIAILAYEGAHLTDLESPFSMQNRGYISFPRRERDIDGPSLLPICLKLLPMRCLSPFLGYRKVWTFCFDSHMPIEQEEMYLSTDIETFADIWGPVWKVTTSGHDDKVLKYNTEGGSIVPWPVDDANKWILKRSERLCHWQSNTNSPIMQG